MVVYSEMDTCLECGDDTLVDLDGHCSICVEMLMRDMPVDLLDMTEGELQDAWHSLGWQ